MSGAVTIRRCATLSEALICNAMLLDRGIHSSISNCAHASVEWWSVYAFGGVGVQVPADQYDEARQAIIDAVEHGAQEIDAQFGAYEPPRRYGRASVWFFWLNFFGVTLIAYMAVMLVLDWVVPTSWILAIDPDFDRIGNQYLFNYGGGYSGGTVDLPNPGPRRPNFWLGLVSYYTLYYGMVISVGIAFTASARRLLTSRGKEII